MLNESGFEFKVKSDKKCDKKRREKKIHFIIFEFIIELRASSFGEKKNVF